MLFHAYYPEHPETILFYSEFYSEPIREHHIWEYYDFVRPKLLPELVGYPLFVFIAVDHKFIIKRKESPTGKFLHVSPETFDELNNGRTVEFHIATPLKSSLHWVDIDPGEDVSFSEVKELTLEVGDVLRKLCNVSRFLFTGSRGFYIELSFSQAKRPREVRSVVSDCLRDYFINNGLEDIVTFNKPKSHQIRIDFTPLKDYGGHRSPFSLSCTKVPGLACLPVPEKHFKKFKKEDALMTKVVRSMGKTLDLS